MNFTTNVKDTLRLLYPVRVIAFGLAVSQVVATVLVYLSNLALEAKINAIQAAGYGSIPGVNIDPPMSGFGAAFGGGVFFTLSTGAGLVLLTFGATLLVSALPSIYRVFKITILKPGRRMLAMVVLLPVSAAGVVLTAGWPTLLVLANIHGFCPGMTAFLVLVPPAVIWATLKWSPRKTGHERLAWRNLFHLFLIVILLALWSTHVNADVFVNLKDNLLLTSRAGTGVVNAYYRYTLFPAEVFKRLSDKQLKTCVLKRIPDAAVADRLEKVLLAHDYFVVQPGGSKADLELVCQGETLALCHGGKTVMTVDRNRFMTSAGEMLEQLSRKVDNNAVFRRFTIVSLVGVAPLVLYLAPYGVFCLLPGILTGIRVASLLAPLLCFGFWISVMTALDTPLTAEMDQGRVTAAIQDGTRKERLAALRYIHENRLDITDFPGYGDLFETGDFSLRYWLISNLGRSRNPGVTVDIMRFLDSDSAYIVCKAMAAAGEQWEKQGDIGRQGYRKRLIEEMKSSNNWYVQFYAYKAARGLGWTPEKSG